MLVAGRTSKHPNQGSPVSLQGQDYTRPWQYTGACYRYDERGNLAGHVQYGKRFGMRVCVQPNDPSQHVAWCHQLCPRSVGAALCQAHALR